jgi:esterase
MELAYTSVGSGPPAVLLHGLLGSGDNLTSVAKWMQAHHTVYLPDLPNHGSSPHTDNAGYGTMIDAVADFIDLHGLQAPVVGGHSMGGKVAMQLALSQAVSVRALIVLDISPQRYKPSHETIMNAMRSLKLDHVKSRADADRKLVSLISEEPVRSFLLKNLQRDGDRYRWRLNLERIMRDYHEILGWEGAGTYEGPALFVGGGQSHYLDAVRDDGLVRRCFPRAEIRMIPQAGHWIHADAPEELAVTIDEFLRSLPTS